MKLLALETSTEFCSAALWTDGAVALREARAGQRHSELLLPMIAALLAEAGIGIAALDGIAFGAGPGSFTGLRIACGAAQGLAFGADLPVAPICTLEALAEAAGGPRVIACLDARMGEIYHAAYERTGDGWRAVREPGLCLPQDAPQVPGDGWTGCGSGFDLHGELLAARYHGRLAGVVAGVVPHAREVAGLAAAVLARGGGVDAALAAPLYVRDRVALKESER